MFNSKLYSSPEYHINKSFWVDSPPCI